MRKFQPVFSLLLVLGVVFGLLPVFPVQTAAKTIVAYPVEGGNIYFDRDSGAITDSDSSVTAADIPAEIDGVKVTKLDHQVFIENTALTRVTIPDGVTEIGNNVFYGCESLAYISIPDTVTEIGICAFQSCNSLKELRIPDSVTKIRSGAFMRCQSLKKIVIPASVQILESQSFQDCPALTEVTILGDIQYIGPFQFSHCPSLTSVTIPKSVTRIWEGAFLNCPPLSEILYEGSDEEWNKVQIDEFNDDLIKAKRVNSVKVDGLSFNVYTGEIVGCDRSVTEMNIPQTIRGAKVTVIRDSAFSDCTSLTSVTLPASISSIGNSLFSGCTSLSSVTLPDSVTSIGNSAFFRCSALKNIILPGSLTSIGDSAFSGCDALVDVHIPRGVLSIGSSAFAGCSALSSVTLPEYVSFIGENAFSECFSLTKADYPGPDERWQAVSIKLGNHFLEKAKNGHLAKHNSLLFDIPAREIIHCDRSETEIDIPETVAGVPVEKIRESVFEDFSSLVNVTLPDSITEISSAAFKGCTSLKNITLPRNLSSIRQSAFAGCTSLAGISLPKSITAVEDSAFADCSALTEVIYSGTKKQWALVEFGDENLNLTQAEISTAIPIGDLNGDEEVDLKDFTLMTWYLSGRSPSIVEENSDINGDGKIDSADATFLARHLENWEVSFFD